MAIAPTAGEREVVFSGVGGQGIQLMAKILAEAAVAEGKHVMLFGMYQGMMRGGPSESTVVIGASEIEAPPIVPQCWALVAMHPEGLDAIARKLRSDGILFANTTLIARTPRPEVACVPLPATALAEAAGNIAGASMVMLGGFVAATEIVPLEAAIAAMQAALPPHRRQRGEENARLMQLGAAHLRIASAAASAPPPA
jgi:2-oxoglutarate ferredoxin oxidoreductase subunit gamma